MSFAPLGPAASGFFCAHVASTSGCNNWGSDFEDQICGALAENGRSLCFETPDVDSEGQIYPI